MAVAPVEEAMKMIRVNSRRLGIAIGLLGLLIVRPLRAESKCANLPSSQLLKNATAVFSGEAAEVKPVEHFLETRFKISEAFKGTSAAKEIWVFTYSVGSETPPNFEAARRYLVFAHKHEGKLVVNSGCSGTVEFSYAKQSISKLRRLTRNRKG